MIFCTIIKAYQLVHGSKCIIYVYIKIWMTGSIRMVVNTFFATARSEIQKRSRFILFVPSHRV